MAAITIATMTLARTGGEADRLYRSLQALSALGLPIAVADGGSGDEFTARVRDIPRVSLHTPHLGGGPRLLTQIQAVLDAASETNPAYVLYTEPDKEWFFTHRAPEFIRAIDEHPSVGVLVAARNEASFATFPPGQQLPERLFNELCGDTLGAPGDYLYGPLLIRRDLLPLVQRIQEDVGWGWRPYVMAAAHGRGAHVRCHVADLPCPVDQRDENDRAARVYRMRQLSQNVHGLALGLALESSVREG